MHTHWEGRRPPTNNTSNTHECTVRTSSVVRPAVVGGRIHYTLTQPFDAIAPSPPQTRTHARPYIDGGAALVVGRRVDGEVGVHLLELPLQRAQLREGPRQLLQLFLFGSVRWGAWFGWVAKAKGQSINQSINQSIILPPPNTHSPHNPTQPTSAIIRPSASPRAASPARCPSTSFTAPSACSASAAPLHARALACGRGRVGVLCCKVHG